MWRLSIPNSLRTTVELSQLTAGNLCASQLSDGTCLLSYKYQRHFHQCPLLDAMVLPCCYFGLWLFPARFRFGWKVGAQCDRQHPDQLRVDQGVLAESHHRDTSSEAKTDRQCSTCGPPSSEEVVFDELDCGNRFANPDDFSTTKEQCGSIEWLQLIVSCATRQVPPFAFLVSQ